MYRFFAKRRTIHYFLQLLKPATTWFDARRIWFVASKTRNSSPVCSNVAKHVSLSTKFEYYKKVVTQISQLPRNLHCLSPRTAPPPKFFWWDCVTCQRTSRPQLTQRVRAWIQRVWWHSRDVRAFRQFAEMLCREQLRWKNLKLFYPTGKVFAVSPVSDLIITRMKLMNRGKDGNL